MSVPPRWPSITSTRRRDSIAPRPALKLTIPSHPSPSPQPFSKLYRVAMLSAWCLATAHVMVTATCSMVALPSMAIYFHTTTIAIAQALGIGVLAIGFGTLLWAYLCRAKALGRRNTCLLGFTMYIASCVWLLLARSYVSYCAASFFAHFFGCVTHVVPVQQISEMFDDTSRARALASWYTSLVVGSSVGPLIGAGLLAIPTSNNATAFHNMYYFATVSGAFLLMVLVVCVPETGAEEKTDGKHSDEPSSMSATTMVDDKVIEDDKGDTKIKDAGEKSAKMSITTKPSLARRTYSSILFYLPRVLPCAIFNAVVFAISVAVHIIMAHNLPAAPYNFTAVQLGLSFLPTAVSALIGELMGGYAVELGLAQARKRIFSTSYPEQRLWALLLYLPVGVAGLLCFGFGIGKEMHWSISVIAGQGLFACYYTAVASIMLTYLVEAHGGAAHASTVMCVLKITRALFIFATLYIEPAWALSGAAKAMQNAFIEKTAIVVALAMATTSLVLCMSARTALPTKSIVA